jgi:hypothetical protein
VLLVTPNYYVDIDRRIISVACPHKAHMEFGYLNTLIYYIVSVFGDPNGDIYNILCKHLKLLEMTGIDKSNFPKSLPANCLPAHLIVFPRRPSPKSLRHIFDFWKSLSGCLGM